MLFKRAEERTMQRIATKIETIIPTLSCSLSLSPLKAMWGESLRWLVIPNVANVLVALLLLLFFFLCYKIKAKFFDISSIFRLKFQNRTRQQKVDGYAPRPLSLFSPSCNNFIVAPWVLLLVASCQLPVASCLFSIGLKVSLSYEVRSVQRSRQQPASCSLHLLVCILYLRILYRRIFVAAARASMQSYYRLI